MTEKQKNEGTIYEKYIFQNVGKGVKLLAIGVLILGLILNIALSIVMFCNAANASQSYFFGEQLQNIYLVLGFVFLFGGVFLTVLSSFKLYAFGAIAEKYLEEKYDNEN